MTDDLPSAEPSRRTYVMPPSTLTRADWVAVYGEEVMRWHGLTPEARWRESMARYTALMANGQWVYDDRDDDLDEDVIDDLTVWDENRPPPPPPEAS